VNKSDKVLQEDIINELAWDPSVKATQVGVAVKNGVVSLTGHLDTYAEKDAATRAVRRVAGVKAIAVEVDVKLSAEHKRSNTDIAQSAETVLKWHTSVPEGALRLTVEHGWVTLQGEVEWDFQRRSAESVIRTLTGVVGVSNEIKLRAKPQASDLARKIEDALKRQAIRESQHIKIAVDGTTVTLSGSTIWAEAEILPIRNVPVVRPHWPAVPPTRQQVTQAVQDAVTRWDVKPAETQFALALELTWSLDFAGLTELAGGLADFALAQLPTSQPLIIIIEHDYARALGQTVKSLIPQHPLLVVDQVGLQEGDYIDIGRPMLDGRVVPLSVKTLIFYH
jgi:osmotically-inducible protein OsmY